MDNLHDQDEVEKTGNNIVHTIAIIFLIIYIVAEIVTIALVALKILSWFDLLFISVSFIIQLILLFSLDDVIRRVTVLENTLLKKGVIEKQEIIIETLNEQEIELAENGSEEDLSNKGIKFCKECGYQLFPEDKVCPNCGTKVEKD